MGLGRATLERGVPPPQRRLVQTGGAPQPGPQFAVQARGDGPGRHRPEHPRDELLLVPQAGDLATDRLQSLGEQRRAVLAVVQQARDVRQVHAGVAVQADALQPRQILRRVEPVAARRTPAGAEQADAVVVEQRRTGEAAELRELGDAVGLHGRNCRL